LPRLAAALPRRVLPDHLTALGALAAIAIGVCYALSGRGPGWLWAANLLWVINWFGDSLDGTVARVRKIQRPRYGYYLDHMVDMFSVAAILLGLGLSPYLHLLVAIAVLLTFYLLSINVYLEAHVLSVFRFGYGRVSPTEGRVALMLTGSAVAAGLKPPLHLVGPLGLFDLVALAIVAALLVLLMLRIVTNLRSLAALEPANVVKGEP